MKKIVFILISALAVCIGKSQCWQSLAHGGRDHYLAIKTDGTLWAWGNNFRGQLGDGTTIDKNIPTQVGLATDWKEVAIGIGHSLALKNDGTLWSWGYNIAGQLGDGSLINRNSAAQVGTANSWRSIASNNVQSFAIRVDGTLWAWGQNNFGQLGDGTYVNKSSPVQVGADSDWVFVGPGYEHTLAIKINGTLWAWGDNSYGQLGDGTLIGKNSPQQIGLSTNWKYVSCGAGHSLAIKPDGTLWAWGLNAGGQLGDGTNANKSIPVQIGTSNIWRSVSAGANHSMATNLSLHLFTWGGNIYGELGDSSLTFSRNYPAQLKNSLNWNDISGILECSAGIKYDGSLWTWGYNNKGQLGDSTVNDASSVDKRFPTMRACPATIVGIKEQNANSNEFTVFPNPARNILFFRNDAEIIIEKITVIDVLGRNVLEQTGNFQEISVQALSKGIYYALLFSQGKNYRVKFIKE